MIALLYIVTVAYLLLVMALLLSWEAIPFFFRSSGAQPITRVTVIIPVRNEGKNLLRLLEDLRGQEYPPGLLEVIVVDDHSEDNTGNVVKQYIPRFPFPLRLLEIPEELKATANKKKAIEMGVEAASGTLIMTTDGDCRVGSDWVGVMEEFYRVHDCKMICGPVFIEGGGEGFGQMQALEFASLIGSGAATLAGGIPTMCNGANLAYEKAVFHKVNGYEGNREIPSGDDEFLMHKIFTRCEGAVKFIKAPEAIVKTAPQKGLKAFINQRIRWASKWKAYKKLPPRLLAVFIFTFNAMVVTGGILALTGDIPGVLFLEQILIKILAEFVFLRSILAFSGKKIHLIHFFLLQFFYPFYVVFMALAGLKGKYLWKERKIN